MNDIRITHETNAVLSSIVGPRFSYSFHLLYAEFDSYLHERNNILSQSLNFSYNVHIRKYGDTVLTRCLLMFLLMLYLLELHSWTSDILYLLLLYQIIIKYDDLCNENNTFNQESWSETKVMVKFKSEYAVYWCERSSISILCLGSVIIVAWTYQYLDVFSLFYFYNVNMNWVFLSALKGVLLEKQHLLEKTTQELNELQEYKVGYP